ncbi:phosphoribosylglycinamide formyltransferase, partial [Streptomyces sp. NRRL WC-3753]
MASPLPSAASSRPKRLVVLVSGSGTNLQALLDAIAAQGAGAY